MTALYFLNDVNEGGETAFPAADLEGFDESVVCFCFLLIFSSCFNCI